MLSSTLIQINVDNPAIGTITVPKLLPFGYKIERIASIDNEVDYVKNSRNKKPLCLQKLILDDSINLVMEEAFYFANIKEVHWPKSCLC